MIGPRSTSAVRREMRFDCNHTMPQKASVAVNGADGTEGQIRRSFLQPEALLERPAEGVNTMVDLLHYATKKHGNTCKIGTREIVREHKDQKVVRKKVGDKEVEETKTWTFYELTPFHYTTLNQFAENVKKFAKGLGALGFDSSKRFNIFASTAANWQVAAHACFQQGVTFCTAYDTLGPTGLQVSLEEPEVRGMFTNAAHLSVVEKVLDNTPLLETIIYDGEPEPALLETIRTKLSHRQNGRIVSIDELSKLGDNHLTSAASVQPSDIACIMYTSGSTGPPKGVILTHANLVATIAACDQLLMNYLHNTDTVLCYLPLAHILEFAVECFLIFRGFTIGYGRVKTLTSTSVRHSNSDLIEFRPSLLVGVPAVWELIRKGILSKVHQSGFIKQRMFQFAFWAKRNNVEGCKQFADSVVFKAVRQQTGGRLRLALSGGAPISRETHEFLNLALCQIVQGYGMTESSAMCAVLTPQFFKFGCVGVPMSSIEIKLVDVPETNYLSSNKKPQGEVMIRGPSVTQGYFKRPDITRETITPDGWLRTGDIGQWEDDGTLSLIDRKKNLVKLSGGEYIALERLESVYKACNMVSNICVYASSEAKQPMAIVFPREDYLRMGLEERGKKDLAQLSLEEQCKNSQVADVLLEELHKTAKANHFAPMEMLQVILPIAEELPLTAAQKVQRKEVESIYGDAIKKLYP
ncbi:long-chain-fatty-acid--CoA ligase [Malassezia vespertilionis]|uniref:Faa4p n=1 Tax=Malassezia vespertilionis TaxID=2020962 RepID=A0A2N1J894_9BASI|nr:long-chain-fatty-acid--CoA ligase [Malassezia vespertilionis]PKI82768.1 Faa4p [Malassezia vespertilionis]WFD08219.1 long-chain-fatty-acid--CoA ligase [Malassezia vespertilionis]